MANCFDAISTAADASLNSFFDSNAHVTICQLKRCIKQTFFRFRLYLLFNFCVRGCRAAVPFNTFTKCILRKAPLTTRRVPLPINWWPWSANLHNNSLCVARRGPRPCTSSSHEMQTLPIDCRFNDAFYADLEMEIISRVKLKIQSSNINKLHVVKNSVRNKKFD